MIAILYNIRSLANVGSIFRTADGAGFEKIYLVGITPTPLDIFGEERSQLKKLSLGAEKSVPWEHISASKIKTLILNLKADGNQVAALEIVENAVAYHKWMPNDQNKIALIVGHETRGLPKNILKYAEVVLKIPMSGKKESLNVGVAFGVVAFRLRDM